MKIDRAVIDQLLAMDDDHLWQTVRIFASTKKINLSEKTPSKEAMASLRALFTDTDKYDLGAAVKILSNYREKKK